MKSFLTFIFKGKEKAGIKSTAVVTKLPVAHSDKAKPTGSTKLKPAATVSVKPKAGVQAENNEKSVAAADKAKSVQPPVSRSQKPKSSTVPPGKLKRAVVVASNPKPADVSPGSVNQPAPVTSKPKETLPDSTTPSNQDLSRWDASSWVTASVPEPSKNVSVPLSPDIMVR